VSGRLQFNLSQNTTSNTYDPNDLGYIQFANKVNYNASVWYNQFTPTDKLLTYRYGLSFTSFYLYKPYRFSEINVNLSGFWVFKNFWDLSVSINSYPTVQNDYFDLRTPGKYLPKPAEVTFGLDGSTDSRKRLFVSYEFGYALRDADDNGYNRVQLGVRYRFSDKFTLSLNGQRQYEENQRGFAFRRETNGDPIAGFRDYTDFQTVLSGIYNFTPRMNLTLRGRHYWNNVRYNSFYNVDGKGNFSDRAFIAGADENYNAFNVDAFLTWDFRLGSRLIVAWKNWLGDNYGLDGMKYDRYVDNLFRTTGVSHGNELTMKLIFFLDYNQLRRKR